MANRNIAPTDTWEDRASVAPSASAGTIQFVDGEWCFVPSTEGGSADGFLIEDGGLVLIDTEAVSGLRAAMLGTLVIGY